MAATLKEFALGGSKFFSLLLTLWADSADDKLMIFFLENRTFHFMQIVQRMQFA